MEILVRHLESEASMHKRVDMFFLVDSISQCSRGLKGKVLLFFLDYDGFSLVHISLVAFTLVFSLKREFIFSFVTFVFSLCAFTLVISPEMGVHFFIQRWLMTK